MKLTRFFVRLVVVAVVAVGMVSLGVGTSARAMAASNSARSNEVRLVAKLTGGTRASGNADWRQKGDVVRFKAQIEGAAPNTAYKIQINGVTIASFTTNAFGRAERQWESGAPKMKAGDVVKIGPVSGKLALKK